MRNLSIKFKYKRDIRKNMPTFQCKKCKFRWTPREERKTVYTRCPYCAANGTVVTVAGAAEIVRDVDSMFD